MTCRIDAAKAASMTISSSSPKRNAADGIIDPIRPGTTSKPAAAANGASRVPSQLAGRMPVRNAPKYSVAIDSQVIQAPDVIDHANGLACVPGVLAHAA